MNEGLEFQCEASGGSMEDLRLHNQQGRTSGAVKAVSQRASCPNRARGTQPKLWPQFPPGNPGKNSVLVTVGRDVGDVIGVLNRLASHHAQKKQPRLNAPSRLP